MFQPQIEPGHARSAHVNIEIIGIKKVSITKMTKRPPLFYTQVHLHLHFNSCFLLLKYSLLERSRHWFGAEYKTDEWGKVFIVCECLQCISTVCNCVLLWCLECGDTRTQTDIHHTLSLALALSPLYWPNWVQRQRVTTV